jgi:hypothetical protein
VNGLAKGENIAQQAFTTSSDGTIGTSREKARYKSPFLAQQLSVFYAPATTGWSSYL